MVRLNSDIIEVKLLDPTYQVYFKGNARIKDKAEMKQLKIDLKNKGISFSFGGWFD